MGVLGFFRTGEVPSRQCYPRVARGGAFGNARKFSTREWPLLRMGSLHRRPRFPNDRLTMKLTALPSHHDSDGGDDDYCGEGKRNRMEALVPLHNLQRVKIPHYTEVWTHFGAGWLRKVTSVQE